MLKILSLLVAPFTFLLIACTSSKTTSSNKLAPYSPQSPALHDTISQLDSILFDSYNNCKLLTFDSFISEEIEFYHDQGGLSTSKTSLMEALKNNICGKVNRLLLPGSIEVYPIPNFGAIQFGIHRFVNSSEPENAVSRYSKFVHTWKREINGWKLYRVVSLH